MNDINIKTVNILWTGGLDSTYRMVELSRLDVCIQPYYIIDANRKSVRHELKAIERITNDIKAHPQTRATLLQIKLIAESDIQPNKEITAAWKLLYKKYKLGYQYDFIARFAKQQNLKLEVGLEKSPRSKATNAIKGESNLKIWAKNNYKVYIPVIPQTNEAAKLVFENIILPYSLWNMSKLEEIDNFKRLGFEHIVMKTWFCHTPVIGLPCGHCNPCRDCLNEGLAFRVPLAGRILGGGRNVLLLPIRFFKRAIRFLFH